MPNPEPHQSTTFKAECQITMYDQVLIDQESADEPGAPVTAIASIELVAGEIVCTLDASTYRFTAQQCGELADKIASVIRRHGAYSKSAVTWDFAWVKIIYQLILGRSSLQQYDVLAAYGYVPGGNISGASGKFRYAHHYGENYDCYGVVIGICDKLDLPLLGLEDRVFRVSVTDAVWLIEQLCAGGYILSLTESSIADQMISC